MRRLNDFIKQITTWLIACILVLVLQNQVWGYNFEVVIYEQDGTVHQLPYTYRWVPEGTQIDLNDSQLPGWKNPYMGPDSSLYIRIYWLLGAGPDSVGMQIYTDNTNPINPEQGYPEYTGDADNPGGLVFVDEDLGSDIYVPLAWRVLKGIWHTSPPPAHYHPPNYSEVANVFETVVDESRVEISTNLDVNGDGWVDEVGQEEPYVQYDVNNDDKIGVISILSNYEIAVTGLNEPTGWDPPYNIWDPVQLRWENADGEEIPTGRVGYWAPYLWMKDKKDGDPNLTPMEEELALGEDSPYAQSGYPNACYASPQVWAVYAPGGPPQTSKYFQYAEMNFGQPYRYISVVVTCNFGRMPTWGEYKTRLIIELYDI